MEFFYIFLGGALGALFRYLILSMFNTYPINAIGVFFVNMFGCFILGFISYIFAKRNCRLSNNLKSFLTIGFCGSFTTFSAFTHPVLEMFLKHHYIYAFANMFFSVIAGLVFVAWGMNCAYFTMSYLIKTRKFVYRQE